MDEFAKRIGVALLALSTAAAASPSAQVTARSVVMQQTRALAQAQGPRDQAQHRDRTLNPRPGKVASRRRPPPPPPSDYLMGEPVPQRENAVMTLGKPGAGSSRCLTDNATGAASGTYGAAAHTCTLNKDVILPLTADGARFGTIQVTSDNLTLDCGGHTISGTDASAISLDFRDFVTIKNCVFYNTSALNIPSSAGQEGSVGSSNAITFVNNTVIFDGTVSFQAGVFAFGDAQQPHADLVIANNHFRATGVDGGSFNSAVSLGGTRRARYENNRITNLPAADRVAFSFSPVISGNSWSFDVGQAERQPVLQFDTVADPIVRNNVVTGFSGSVINSYGTLNALIEGNDLSRSSVGPPGFAPALSPGYVSMGTTIRNNSVRDAQIGIQIDGIAARIYGNKVEGSRYADLTVSNTFPGIVEGETRTMADPAGNFLAFDVHCADYQIRDNDLSGRAEFLWVNTPGAQVQQRPGQLLAGVALCGAHGARVSWLATEALYISNTNGAIVTDVLVADQAIPRGPGALKQPREAQILNSNDNRFVRLAVIGNRSVDSSVDPLDSNNASFLLSGTSGNTFDHLKVSGNAFTGARIEGASSATFQSSDFSGNLGHGVVVVDADSLVLKDGTMSNNGGIGLFIQAFTSTSVFQNLTVRGNQGGDVDFSPGTCSNTVTNVTTGKAAAGFLYSKTPVHLSGGSYSTILVCGGNGSTFDGVTAKSIQLNNLTGARVSGSSAQSITLGNVSGSQVLGSTSAELLLSNSSNNVLSGNTLLSPDSPQPFSLYVDPSSSGNQLTGNQTGGRSVGIFVQGNGTLLDGNQIGTSIEGIVLLGTDAVLKHNRVCQSEADFSIVNFGSNNTGDLNTCTGTQNYADASAPPNGVCTFTCQ